MKQQNKTVVVDTWKMKHIEDTLRLTQNIYSNPDTGETALDRSVNKARQYAKESLAAAPPKEATPTEESLSTLEQMKILPTEEDDTERLSYMATGEQFGLPPQEVKDWAKQNMSDFRYAWAKGYKAGTAKGSFNLEQVKELTIGFALLYNTERMAGRQTDIANDFSEYLDVFLSLPNTHTPISRIYARRQTKG